MCCSGVKSGNEQFAQDVAAWTFQESLALRIDSVAHHRVDETEPREMYTTNDHVVRTLLFILIAVGVISLISVFNAS